MNDILCQIEDKHTARFNMEVINGNVKGILEDVPAILDGIIQTSIMSVNPNVDLKYLGYRVMTPEDEHAATFKNPKIKTQVDTAISFITPIELVFEYEGVKFKRMLQLPYAEDGNILRMGGTNYHTTPVLSYRVISPNYKEVFVRLIKAKLLFKTIVYSFIKNGNRQPLQVIYSTIMRLGSRKIVNIVGRVFPPAALYNVIRYGVRGCLLMTKGERRAAYASAYREYTDKKKAARSKDILSYAAWIAGYGYMVLAKHYKDREKLLVITTDDNVYKLKDEYDIYESQKLKPKGYKGDIYTPHDVKIAIHKSINTKPSTEHTITSMLYVLDVFTENAIEFPEIFNSKDLESEKLYWEIMLGRIYYKNNYTVDRMGSDIHEHFTTLEGYIDDISKEKLVDAGVDVVDFFELLEYILDMYNILINNSKAYNSDINNRYIDIIYYLLHDIIVSFNKVILGINKRISKRALTFKEIQRIFANELSPKKIFGLVKSTAMNLAINMVDVSSDIKYPKITSVLEDQSRGVSVKKGGKNQFPDSARTIKAVDLVFGSVMFLGKKAPSPIFKINPHIQYSKVSGTITIPDHLVPIVNAIDARLNGKMYNENLLSEIEETETVEISD